MNKKRHLMLGWLCDSLQVYETGIDCEIWVDEYASCQIERLRYKVKVFSVQRRNCMYYYFKEKRWQGSSKVAGISKEMKKQIEKFCELNYDLLMKLYDAPYETTNARLTFHEEDKEGNTISLIKRIGYHPNGDLKPYQWKENRIAEGRDYNGKDKIQT